MLLNKIEELARQNTQLMQKEKNIREINDELKEENIRLHKKIQGDTTFSTLVQQFHKSLVNHYSNAREVIFRESV
ncbi:hypothetical protein ACROYT_G002044 [Oculina patagonica]